MDGFKRVEIKGFRRLQNFNIEMRPLMVMIGANGVGKTSVLDAFSILAASAAGRLNIELNKLGGISNVITFDKGEAVSLSVDMEVPNFEPLNYLVQLKPKVPASYAIEMEILSQQRIPGEDPFKHIESHFEDVRYFEIEKKNLVRPSWVHNPLETSLSQVPKMYRQPEELRNLLSLATLYHVLDVGPRAPIKLPQQINPADLPGSQGEDLISYLFNLQQTDPNRYEIFEDTLKAAYPGFEKLNFPIVAAGMLAMTWKDKDYTKPFFMNQLSEGTLRFLWLASLLQSSKLPSVTMIDEPEVSLHPELLSLLADLMREASLRTQLIIATHSDRLIRFLEPNEVVVMDVAEDGSANAIWADSLDLDHWLADYSLDEVWQMGRMGGRP